MSDYTSTSVSDRLAAVRQSIQNCLAAEAYTHRGREKRSARLKDLLEVERWLLEQQQQESMSGRMSSVGQYVRPK